MSATAPDGTRRLAAPLLVLAGIAVALAAWLVPVNLKSVSPALLRAAALPLAVRPPAR